MNRLVIKQNTVTENVTSELITKLYTNAKEIKDYEELNEIEDSQVELLGNLLVVHAYEDEVTYLESKFLPNLSINVTGGTYIKFELPYVALILMEHNLVQNDGIGITKSAMQAVTAFALDYWFRENTDITKFNELKYFTNLHTLNASFYRCTNLEEIDLRHVTSLPLSAFWQCSNLKTVGNTINLQSIASNAFMACVKLELINLSNATTIGTESFNWCTTLTAIDLSSCTSLGNGAFLNCTSLTSVGTLNSLLANIPDSCFRNCSSLTTFDFSNITSIGYKAFDGCTSLTSIDLSGVTLIKGGYEDGAFLGCTSLTTVSGLNNPKYLYPFIFYLCTSLGTNLNLVLNVLNPNSNSSTAVNIAYAFYGTKYKNVEVHSLYTLNLGYTFGRCNNLEKIDLSDINGLATTDICYYSSVLTIILPANNIPTIDYRFAGNDCPNLTKIIILSSTPPSLETTSLDTVWKTTCKIYVPDAALTTYQTTTGWDTILDRIFSLSHPDLNDITWYTKSNP